MSLVTPHRIITRLTSAALLLACGALPVSLPFSSTLHAATHPTTMSASTPTGFTSHSIPSAERPFLACRLLKHDDFHVADMPTEEISLDDPKKFLPLTILVAPMGPMVVTVAARPAYDDGTVSDWLAYLCREEGYAHMPVAPIQVGALRGVTCDAVQQGDGIQMTMRFILLEDGGRLFQVVAMAPRDLWAALEPRLQTMLMSFQLAEVRGAKVALFPGQPVPTSSPAAAAETLADTADASAHRSSSTSPAQLPGDDLPSGDAASAPAETAKLTPDEFAKLVLAADASSLDQEHPINANLRNRGIGFAVRVMAVDETLKAARVAAGAIEGFFRVPFGWHAIDDGRRVLVLDDKNRIQVNLDMRSHEGRSVADAARSFAEAYLAEQPQVEIITHEMDGIALAGVRGLRINDEELTQFFLVKDVGREGYYLVARATAGTPDDTKLSLDLAGDILAGFETFEQHAAMAAR